MPRYARVALVVGAAVLISTFAEAGAHATGPIPPQAPSASKPAVFRNGMWFLRASTLPGAVAVSSFQYGKAGDKPVMGDWDGDGDKTVGVVRGHIWYLRNTNSAGPSDAVFSYGRDGDIPLAADWDSNGTDTPGVVRCDDRSCTTRRVYVRTDLPIGNHKGSGVANWYKLFNGAGTPIAADWDNLPGAFSGDSPAYMSNGVWTYSREWHAQTVTRFKFGTTGDQPIVGDWGIDGQTSVGVVRRGTWMFGRGVHGGPAYWSVPFGRPTDTFLVWE